MKVLVTGADGFIGSHLTELLINLGYYVKALSYYNSFNYWGWLEEIPRNNNLEIITGDIRDLHFCQNLCKDVDIVFHLAALIAIPYSYIAPESYIDTNVKGTYNICQAALDNNVKRIIHTSTSEVYGTAQYVPIDEKHPLQPQSPYSASKMCADAIAMSFFYSFGLPLTIVRPFNTYGPRQSARAVIPTIITQICAGNEKLFLGDVTTTRDLNYVEDTCKGFVAVTESNLTIGEVINIGSNTEVSIESVANLIKTIMKSNIEIVTDEQRLRPEKSEVRRLRCDNTKLITLTGFRPKYTLVDGLHKTIEWFKDPNNLTKYKTKIYNV